MSAPAAAANLRGARAFLPRVPLPGASDDRLVARVRAGDERAFEAIYDRHHRGLLAFCRHMLGDRADAEDALQHTFVAAYRALGADDRAIQLKAWLYAIARNRCLSILRARREAVGIEDAAEAAVSSEGLPEVVERRADLRDLLVDLRRLPEDQREALVLSEVGALSHDEVAEVLGVRREKVKALVFQARENLLGWREGREADCRAIREELSTLTGSALRRGRITRHLATCEGCRQFKAEVQRQRAAMALVLPVVPGLGLKSSVLGAVFGGGSAAAAATGAGVGAGAVAGGGAIAASKGVAAKALVALAVAGGAGGAGYVAVEQVTPDHKPAPVTAPAKGGATGTPQTRGTLTTPAGTSVSVAVPAAGEAGAKGKKHGKGAKGEHGGGSDRPSQTPAGSGPAAAATPGVPATGSRGRGRDGAPGQSRPKHVQKPKKAHTPVRARKRPVRVQPTRPPQARAPQPKPAPKPAPAPAPEVVEPAPSAETSAPTVTTTDGGSTKSGKSAAGAVTAG